MHNLLYSIPCRPILISEVRIHCCVRGIQHKRWVNTYFFFFYTNFNCCQRERYEDSLQLTAIEYTSLSTLDDKLTVPAGVALNEKHDTDLAAAAASRINFLLISIWRNNNKHNHFHVHLLKTPSLEDILCRPRSTIEREYLCS